MIRPGAFLVRALAVVAGSAVAAIWWPPLGLVALGAGIAIIALAALEAHWLYGVRLHLDRPSRLAIALGNSNQLPTVLSHDSRVPLVIIARQRLNDLVGGGAVTRSGRCLPGQQLDLGIPVRGAERGDDEIEQLTVGVSRFGLVERITTLGGSCRLSVLPDLNAVRNVRRQFDALFLRGMGSRLAPRSGQGREFDRLREYVQGDDWRHIEWKATARRGPLIMRDFRVERSQDVVLCIDRGHRMAARVSSKGGLLTRLDHAVNAAVLSAWLCNRCEDRVGMFSFSAEVETGIGQGRGPTHLAALTAFATGIAPAWLHTDYRVMAAHVTRRLKQRSLILIATVLPEQGDHGELLQAVRMLRGRHLPLILVMTDPVLDAGARALPGNRRELCRALVAADIVDGRRQLIMELRRLGALVVETDPDAISATVINAYLDVKRKQLL